MKTDYNQSAKDICEEKIAYFYESLYVSINPNHDPKGIEEIAEELALNSFRELQHMCEEVMTVETAIRKGVKPTRSF